MTSSESSDPTTSYGFNRRTCLQFTLFSLAMVAMFVVFVALLGDQMYLAGFVPGWLFGSLGAVMLSAAGVKWARRFTHSGPALVLSDSGITSVRAGGVATPFVGTIRWDEIASVSTGPHGTVALHLHDAGAFRARQSPIARLLSWHPSPRTRDAVFVGGIGLAVGGEDLFSHVQTRLDRARLEASPHRLIEPDSARQEE